MNPYNHINSYKSDDFHLEYFMNQQNNNIENKNNVQQNENNIEENENENIHEENENEIEEEDDYSKNIFYNNHSLKKNVLYKLW